MKLFSSRRRCLSARISVTGGTLATWLFGAAALSGCQALAGLDGLKPGETSSGVGGTTASTGGGGTATGSGGVGGTGTGGSTTASGGVGGTGTGGSGGAGGTGGTGGMTTSTGGSTGTGGAPVCPMLTTTPCQSGECSGTCVDGNTVCEVSCPAGSPICNSPPMGTDLPCLGPNMVDMDCRFKCSPGTGSCKGLNIRCSPKHHRCDIVCSGMGACDGTTIDCADGDCSLTCENGGCSPMTKLNCGSGKCDVVCGAGGSNKPAIADSKACEKSVQGCPQ